MNNKTILTSSEVKEIINNVFNGDAEKLTIIDENGDKIEKTFAEYLNVEFFSWRNRLEKGENWYNSIQNSLNNAYCLCEIVEEATTGASDFDNETITGKLSFLIQADKCNNLEYYCKFLRNKYMGKVQTIKNSYGDTLKAFIDLGCLLYEEEPQETQIGESIVCSLNFTLAYVSDTSSYDDTQIFLSFTDFLGDVSSATAIPLTKAVWQNIFSGSPLTNQVKPTITGRVNASMSQSIGLQFYDFKDNAFINALNEKFFTNGAVAKWDSTNNTWNTNLTKQVNIPIFMVVKTGNDLYKYKYVIIEQEKIVSNGDFNVSSLTLATYGKE